MLINEACKTTGLTKKAIEYYIEHNLINPNILENGYRDFNDGDIEKLKKIYVYRKLGISTEEIKNLFSDDTGEVFQKILLKKEMNLEKEKLKKEIFEKIKINGIDDEVINKLKFMEQSSVVTERLLESFPGYFGRFFCLHFAKFLNNPIETEEQQIAFDEIISFLDNMEPLNFPKDLELFLSENTKIFDSEKINDIIKNQKQSIENPEKFMEENREFINYYIEYKQSEEYRNSPVFKIQELLRDFCNTSGYYDIFIPAMKRLSSSYAKYYEQLEMANDKFIIEYPEFKI